VPKCCTRAPNGEQCSAKQVNAACCISMCLNSLYCCKILHAWLLLMQFACSRELADPAKQQQAAAYIDRLQVELPNGQMVAVYEHGMSLAIVALRGSVPQQWIMDFKSSLGAHWASRHHHASGSCRPLRQARACIRPRHKVPPLASGQGIRCCLSCVRPGHVLADSLPSINWHINVVAASHDCLVE